MHDHPLRTKIEEVLTEVQPMLGMHGGSITLVGITGENVVELRFEGACIGCAAAEYTLEYGLKELLMLKVEEINDVVAINDEPVTHAAPLMSPSR